MAGKGYFPGQWWRKCTFSWGQGYHFEGITLIAATARCRIEASLVKNVVWSPFNKWLHCLTPTVGFSVYPACYLRADYVSMRWLLMQVKRNAACGGTALSEGIVHFKLPLVAVRTFQCVHTSQVLFPQATSHSLVYFNGCIWRHFHISEKKKKTLINEYLSVQFTFLFLFSAFVHWNSAVITPAYTL